MRRFHVHISVENLEQSVLFYSNLFGRPMVQQADYAKWMIDDPRINFAISTRGHETGLNHLGIQVESDDELRGMRDQLAAADAGMVSEQGASCCYAKSDKYWITDPQGIAWETFHSLSAIPMFGESRWDREEADAKTACAPVTGRDGSCFAASATNDAAPRAPSDCCAPVADAPPR